MIALRLNFTDVLREGTLKNVYINGKSSGLQFDVRLSYYRGIFLSCIDELCVKVDGEQIPDDAVTFILRGEEYGMADLENLSNVFWPIAEPATVRVFKDGGYESGEHRIDLRLMFRSPYIPISDGIYMPDDGSDSRVMVLN